MSRNVVFTTTYGEFTIEVTQSQKGDTWRCRSFWTKGRVPGPLEGTIRYSLLSAMEWVESRLGDLMAETDPEVLAAKDVLARARRAVRERAEARVAQIVNEQ